MDLFSHFCNICCKTGNENLNNICEEKMENVKNTLITFIGHADIINKNFIYLCPPCCQELMRFSKFREMCVSNLILLRQMYFNMKSKLELEEEPDAVTKMLKKFLHAEFLRYNNHGESSPTDSISTKLKEIVNDSTGQIRNLHSEGNGVQFDGNCEYISLINNGGLLVDESTKEELYKNTEMQNTFENIKLEKIGEDFDVSKLNNSNRSDLSQIGFTKLELYTKIERENITSPDFELKNCDSECSEDVKLNCEVSFISNSNQSDILQTEATKEKLFVKEGSSTSCMDVKIEENMEIEMKVEANCKNKSNFGTVSTHQGMPHARENCHKSCQARLQSTAYQQAQPDVESHTCTLCNKTFRNRLYLNRHVRRHSGARPYKCTICNKAFTQSSTLIAHQRLHNGAKPYECTICNKTFTRSSHLTEHKRTHSGVKPYRCNVCNKAFTRSSTLTVHTRIHNDSRPYKCTVCNKLFRNLSHLITHERIHTGARPYRCTVCNKAFAYKSHLTEHERIHSGTKLHKCSVCNKEFTRPSSLIVHERRHSGMRPYKCYICNKAFTDSSTLAAHTRIHSGAKPYKCTVCNKAFTQLSSLTGHKRIHSGARPYECTVCNKTFANSSHLAKHERIHSGAKPYKCTVCNKAFTQSSNLNAHKFIHIDALE